MHGHVAVDRRIGADARLQLAAPVGFHGHAAVNGIDRSCIAILVGLFRVQAIAREFPELVFIVIQ